MKMSLFSCDAFTARELLWDRLRNGDLLKAAELARFDALLMADRSIFYQQNNAVRLIALVVLSTNDWEILRRNIDLIGTGLQRARPGSFELLQLSPSFPDSTGKAGK